MAVIVAFPRPAAGTSRARDDGTQDGAASRLRSALDGIGKTLADLLLALLADLEDSSLRLSLIIERTAAEGEKSVLRAEQQEVRATIADLRRTIGGEGRPINRV